MAARTSASAERSVKNKSKRKSAVTVKAEHVTHRNRHEISNESGKKYERENEHDKHREQRA